MLVGEIDLNPLRRTCHDQDQADRPSGALAWAVLDRSLAADEEGVFLCTAHPAKFLEVLEETLDIEIALPPELEAVQHRAVLSHTIPDDFAALRKELGQLH